jgi:predicted dinucleotide-binding enzyme
MRIGLIGIGRIGGNCARFFARAGHDLVLSFSRDEDKLRALAHETGGRAGLARDAVEHGEVVVVSIPWDAIPGLIAEVGDFQDKIVIDTCNQFGSIAKPGDGETAASLNAARMPRTRYTKSFNTLTAAFQAEVAGRRGDDRVVQWLCGDDGDAKRVVADLIAEVGFAPVDLGGNAQAAVMEAPRRPDAVYGEEYRLAEALRVVEAVRAGRAIPPTPRY